MEATKKQNLKRILIYLGITFGLTWGYCFFILYPLVNGQNLSGIPAMVTQLLVAACMFFPAIGVLLTRLITKEGFNVFDGVIETNDGKTVGEEGKTLDDATITGGINWYYKNVVVK